MKNNINNFLVLIISVIFIWVIDLNSVMAQYTLTVSKSGTGNGTIIGGSINCGSTCSQTSITSGTSIILNAIPDINSDFIGWNVEECIGNGSCNVVATRNSTITATFSVKGSTSVTTPIAGSCSTMMNICNVGTFLDIADANSTNYLWSCLGLNGGTTALCFSPKSANVNATTNPSSYLERIFRPKSKTYVPPDLSTTTSGTVELTVPSGKEILKSLISSIFTNIKTGVENTKNLIGL